MRRDYFKLLIRAVSRLLISPPTPKMCRVPKAIALHVLVSNLNHELGSAAAPTTNLFRDSSDSARPAFAARDLHPPTLSTDGLASAFFR